MGAWFPNTDFKTPPVEKAGELALRKVDMTLQLSVPRWSVARPPLALAPPVPSRLGCSFRSPMYEKKGHETLCWRPAGAGARIFYFI